jgi:predicted GNAT family acetyltransferase
MATPPALTVRDNRQKNRFEIELGDGSFAIAEYRLYLDKIIFTHTEVPPAHEGQGLGTKLIEATLGGRSSAPRERVRKGLR